MDKLMPASAGKISNVKTHEIQIICNASSTNQVVLWKYPQFSCSFFKDELNFRATVRNVIVSWNSPSSKLWLQALACFRVIENEQHSKLFLLIFSSQVSCFITWTYLISLDYYHFMFYRLDIFRCKFGMRAASVCLFNQPQNKWLLPYFKARPDWRYSSPFENTFLRTLDSIQTADVHLPLQLSKSRFLLFGSICLVTCSLIPCCKLLWSHPGAQKPLERTGSCTWHGLLGSLIYFRKWSVCVACFYIEHKEYLNVSLFARL